MICDEVHRHTRCDQVVVLKVQSGTGAGSTLYAEFDRRLLDHRTPFLARRQQDGSIEVSTLNTQLQVPGEVRFVAYPSLEGLPQPLRDQAQGVQPVNVAQAAAPAAQLRDANARVPKPPRPAPAKVQITYKHRRQEDVRLKAKKTEQIDAKPVAAPAPSANTTLPTRIAPPASTRRPKQKVRAPSVSEPLTNMALAFQRLAASDPDVEQLLITGFRDAPGSP